MLLNAEQSNSITRSFGAAIASTTCLIADKGIRPKARHDASIIFLTAHYYRMMRKRMAAGRLLFFVYCVCCPVWGSQIIQEYIGPFREMF